MNSASQPIKIEVSFYAQLRRVAGSKSRTFSLPSPSSVRHLLGEVVLAFPDLQAEILDEQGALYGHIRLLINGHDLQHEPEGRLLGQRGGRELLLHHQTGVDLPSVVADQGEGHGGDRRVHHVLLQQLAPPHGAGRKESNEV